MGKERVLAEAPSLQAVRDEFFAALQRLNRGRERETVARPAPCTPKSDEDVLAEFMKDFPDSIVVRDD
jgi:hypothetical protein